LASRRRPQPHRRQAGASHAAGRHRRPEPDAESGGHSCHGSARTGAGSAQHAWAPPPPCPASNRSGHCEPEDAVPHTTASPTDSRIRPKLKLSGPDSPAASDRRIEDARIFARGSRGNDRPLMECHAHLSTGRPPNLIAEARPAPPGYAKAQFRDSSPQHGHGNTTPDLRITMRRQRVPDRPGFQGQRKQKTPGQRPDLGFTMEPPSGFEPETYALRDRERSCCVVPGRAAE
jgi:hypothetical protein